MPVINDRFKMLTSNYRNELWFAAEKTQMHKDTEGLRRRSAVTLSDRKTVWPFHCIDVTLFDVI